jgi:hypothetical protein
MTHAPCASVNLRTLYFRFSIGKTNAVIGPYILDFSMSKELKRLLNKKRKRLLSTGAIARMAGLSPCRIWQLYRDGKLWAAEVANPAEVLAGKQPRFRRTPRLARWCRKRREQKELRRNRKPLKGDKRGKPLGPHYLTFINNFNKWDTRVRHGLAPRPTKDVMRCNFEHTLRRIIELCGVDWAASLLEKCRVTANRRQSLPQTRRDKNCAPWRSKGSLPDLWRP